MVKMSCERHDELAAGSQFVTHLTGRLLGRLGLPVNPIATKGYRALLQLVDNTQKDSFDLFYALYSHNPASGKTLADFAKAFEELRAELQGGSDTKPASDRVPRVRSPHLRGCEVTSGGAGSPQGVCG